MRSLGYCALIFTLLLICSVQAGVNMTQLYLWFKLVLISIQVTKPVFVILIEKTESPQISW